MVESVVVDITVHRMIVYTAVIFGLIVISSCFIEKSRLEQNGECRHSESSYHRKWSRCWFEEEKQAPNDYVHGLRKSDRYCNLACYYHNTTLFIDFVYFLPESTCYSKLYYRSYKIFDFKAEFLQLL